MIVKFTEIEGNENQIGVTAENMPNRDVIFVGILQYIELVELWTFRPLHGDSLGVESMIGITKKLSSLNKESRGRTK